MNNFTKNEKLIELNEQYKLTNRLDQSLEKYQGQQKLKHQQREGMSISDMSKNLDMIKTPNLRIHGIERYTMKV